MAELESKPPYKLPSFHNWTPQASFYHPLQAGSIDGTDLFPHDKGVLRAMLSRYKPNKSISGDPDKTLFVGRLSKDTSQDTIQNIFEHFGELQKCRLVRDFVTGFSRGFAFVEFKRKRDALVAASETHKMNIDGREILVDLECERSLEGWKPRRFGGGFGGRKESGQLRFGGVDRPFKRPLPSQVERFQRGSERDWKDSGISYRKDGDRGERERHRDRDRDVFNRDRGGHGGDRSGHGGDRSGHGGDRSGHGGDRSGHGGDRSGHDRDRRDRETRRDIADRGKDRDIERERGRDRDKDRDKRRRERYSEDSKRPRVAFEDRERRTHHSSKESSRSRDRDDDRDKEDKQEREKH